MVRHCRSVPVQLHLFDVLAAGGALLLAMPYAARRERLAGLGLDTGQVRTPPWYPGGAADVQAASAAHGLEGVVGTPLASAMSGAVIAASPRGGAGIARRPAGGRAACSSGICCAGLFPGLWVRGGTRTLHMSLAGATCPQAARF